METDKEYIRFYARCTPKNHICITDIPGKPVVDYENNIELTQYATIEEIEKAVKKRLMDTWMKVYDKYTEDHEVPKEKKQPKKW